MKKNDIMPFAATMDATRYYQLSEVRKKKTNTIWYHLYVESQEWHEWSYLWNRNRLSHTEQSYGCQGGSGAGTGMEWSRCKLLYIEWINKVLLYITGNYIQYPMINHNRKEYKKNVHICITESLCCTAEINTTL